jgi:hypothetical protein
MPVRYERFPCVCYDRDGRTVMVKSQEELDAFPAAPTPRWGTGTMAAMANRPGSPAKDRLPRTLQLTVRWLSTWLAQRDLCYAAGEL